MDKILRAYYGLIVVGLFCLLSIAYSVNTNHRFYKCYGPFYDSLAYHNEVARVVGIMEEGKVTMGLVAASHNINGFVPIVITALISFYFGLDRAFGCIANGILMLLSSITIYYYLCKVRSYSEFFGAGVAIFLNSIKLIYLPLGGLSDFRMDLGLYFCFEGTAIFYFVTYYKNSLKSWILLALALSITLLTRSTSSVYILIALGPLFILRLFNESPNERKATLGGAIICFLIMSLLSGWFYILNYHQISYYYLIWNIDATVHLPVSQSIRHLVLMASNVGTPTWVGGVLFLVLRAMNGLVNSSQVITLSRSLFSILDIRWLWIGIILQLLFILKGMGLNPYISLPSAFGFLAFLAFPGKKAHQMSNNKNFSLCILFIAILISGTNAFIGNKVFLSLTKNQTGATAGYQKMIGSLIFKAKQLSKKQIIVDSPFLGVFGTDALQNVLIYDYHFKKIDDYLTDGQLVIKKSELPILAVCPQEWKVLSEKSVGNVPKYINENVEKLDFLILPNKNTVYFLKKDLGYLECNKHLDEIFSVILKGNQWEKLNEEFSITDHEQYNLYIKKQEYNFL